MEVHHLWLDRARPSVPERATGGPGQPPARLEQSSTTMRPSTVAVEPNCIASEIAGSDDSGSDVVRVSP